MQRLLKGVQYGFRSRRARQGGVLDDEVRVVQCMLACCWLVPEYSKLQSFTV